MTHTKGYVSTRRWSEVCVCVCVCVSLICLSLLFSVPFSPSDQSPFADLFDLKTNQPNSARKRDNKGKIRENRWGIIIDMRHMHIGMSIVVVCSSIHFFWVVSSQKPTIGGSHFHFLLIVTSPKAKPLRYRTLTNTNATRASKEWGGWRRHGEEGGRQ